MAAVVCIPIHSEVGFPFPHILSLSCLLLSWSEPFWLDEISCSAWPRTYTHINIINWLLWVTQKKKTGHENGRRRGDIQKDLDEGNMNKIHCIHVWDSQRIHKNIILKLFFSNIHIATSLLSSKYSVALAPISLQGTFSSRYSDNRLFLYPTYLSHFH